MTRHDPTPPSAPLRPEPFAEGVSCPSCGKGEGVACVYAGHLHTICLGCGHLEARGSSVFRLLAEYAPETFGRDGVAQVFVGERNWVSFGVAWVRWFYRGLKSLDHGSLTARFGASTLLGVCACVAIAFPLAAPLVALGIYCPPQPPRSL